MIAPICPMIGRSGVQIYRMATLRYLSKVLSLHTPGVRLVAAHSLNTKSKLINYTKKHLYFCLLLPSSITQQKIKHMKIHQDSSNILHFCLTVSNIFCISFKQSNSQICTENPRCKSLTSALLALPYIRLPNLY